MNISVAVFSLPIFVAFLLPQKRKYKHLESSITLLTQFKFELNLTLSYFKFDDFRTKKQT